MKIGVDDPLAADVRGLLDEHLAELRRTSPPESMHALDPESLAALGIVFLTARDDDGALLGCGALSPLPDGDVELKSMRTALAARGRGVATALLEALVGQARSAGARRLLLETGTQQFFVPAVQLYLRHGFTPTGPFAGYTDDPNSRYLALPL